jgi:hypothetical protein
MRRMLFSAIILGLFSSNVRAENYNIATTELIGEKDPDISEDFVRNIFTKKELNKSSLLIKSEPLPVNVVVLYSKIALFGFSTGNKNRADIYNKNLLVGGYRVARCQTPCEVKIPDNAPFLIRSWREGFSTQIATPLPEWKLKIPGAPGFGKKLKNNLVTISLTENPNAPKSEEEIVDD